MCGGWLRRRPVRLERHRHTSMQHIVEVEALVFSVLTRFSCTSKLPVGPYLKQLSKVE